LVWFGLREKQKKKNETKRMGDDARWNESPLFVSVGVGVGVGVTL
jgi:hypothetical protein